MYRSRPRKPYQHNATSSCFHCQSTLPKHPLSFGSRRSVVCGLNVSSSLISQRDTLESAGWGIAEKYIVCRFELQRRTEPVATVGEMIHGLRARQRAQQFGPPSEIVIAGYGCSSPIDSCVSKVPEAGGSMPYSTCEPSARRSKTCAVSWMNFVVNS